MNAPVMTRKGRAARRQGEQEQVRYVIFNGTNAGPRGWVRRMTRSADGGFAPLHVVSDLDDTGPAAANFNLLGPVVSIESLNPAERVRFAKLANMTRDDQEALAESKGLPADTLKMEENGYWVRLLRFTGPGLDIDLHEKVKGTPEGRAAAEAIACKLVAAEAANGIALRVAWSSGAKHNGIHLDWLWPGELAEVHLVKALKARTVRLCAKHGIPTSEAKTDEDLAWVDLNPLGYGPASRQGLWRPLGGKAKTGRDGRKELTGWPLEGRPLTREDLEVELAQEEAQAEEKATPKRHRQSPLERVVPLRPKRQSELGPLRAFLRELRPADDQERDRQRMAWAAALLLDGLSVKDAAWCIASSHGNRNTRAAQIVRRTRELINSPRPEDRWRGKPYLEGKLGTATMARYGDVLARIKVKGDPGQPKAPKPKRRDRYWKPPQDATGNLRRMVRAVTGLNRKTKAAMVAYAEVLRGKDGADPAIGGLLRPGLCRTIHERINCGLCKGERGRRRLACEDELCAWCHGQRVLHEHDLALATWLTDEELKAPADPRDAKRILGLEVHGFKTIAEANEWVRRRSLGRIGIKVLRLRTHAYMEPEAEEVELAKARGDLEPAGRITHGVLLLARHTGWGEAVLQGARLQERGDVTASVTVYTIEGAAEAAAVARWNTHLALRTAAVLGELPELARVLRDQFRRHVATSMMGALDWPGRAEARASICAEVAARREEELEKRGDDPDGKHGEGGACHGCPEEIAAPVYKLMANAREDAEVVHESKYPHALIRAWLILREHARQAALVAKHAAATAARALAQREENLITCPF